MDYTNLTEEDLNEAIGQTESAITKAKEMLAVLKEPKTDGLRELAEATSRRISTLEDDLEELNEALERK